MKRGMQGRWLIEKIGVEKVRAFVPAPLPPDPGIVWSAELQEVFDQAMVALGRLDGVSRLLPDSALLLYSHVRKEAVLPSMIEGTQSSLSDLMLFELDEAPGVPLGDVREVSRYVSALNHGLGRLREGFHLSLRLLREIHSVLLSEGRGSKQTPGEFRRSQNWIGGTRPGNAFFVPPPAEDVPECLSRLEAFLHGKPIPTPALVKAALAHVQFEMIHPFLDGNGRLGRLLISLLLCREQVLREPLLFLSLYFKTHRQEYYDMLTRVRMQGDWEAWLAFFAEAVRVCADQAVETVRELLDLAERDQERIKALGRGAASARQVLRSLLEQPIATSNRLVERTGLTPATVNKALSRLQELGIVRELTEQRRNRVFSYTGCLEILNRGMDLPAAGSQG